MLLEHVKFLRRQTAATDTSHDDDEGDNSEDAAGVTSLPTKDMSLHDGQKIRINLKSTRRSDAAVSGTTSSDGAVAQHGLGSKATTTTSVGLRPPPPAPSTDVNEDDWGDFETA